MAKRKFGGSPMGGMGNMQQLLKQAQKMQSQMEATQEELEDKEYEVTSGGGAIAITINGKKEISKLSIKPEVLQDGDVEMLQDMLIVAFNDALKIVSDDAEEKMSGITGGAPIPGMF